MKRLIFAVSVILLLLACFTACADPAMTDGTVTAWIGENNYFFLTTTEGQPKQLSAPMKEILSINDSDVIALTHENQIIAVKKDGSSFSYLSMNATEEEIAAYQEAVFALDEGKLSVDETVYSERAAAAVSDGLVLYWINRGDNACVLMQKELPGREQDAFGRAPVTLTGISVPEPAWLCVTGEALTVTGTDHTVLSVDLKTGETKTFPASGQETAAACIVDGRLYRYLKTETESWELESIQNDAMQLSTVTPAPTMTPTPTPTPSPTPRVTSAPTATPKGSSGNNEGDGNIYKGATGRTVRKIQQRLLDLGYPVGKVDGSYGEQTQIAVNLFYDAIHAREHNYITPSMRTKLFADNAPEYDPYMPLQKGDRGLSVLYMQTQLKKEGYDPGKLDGIYGENTVKAVAEYQKAIGYVPAEKEVPGEYASHDLLEKLLGPEETPTVTPTGTPEPTATPKPATPTDL